MSESFVARMKVHGLRLPEAELVNLEAFVADLDRAAEFVSGIQRSYAEEPSNVFRLAPQKAK